MNKTSVWGRNGMGAEFVSRAPLTGLGADGSGSGYTFLLGFVLAEINAPSIYEWRAEAGNALMKAGFTNFSMLYNEGGDPVRWDINQLISEQKTLQPIHEKYLKDRFFFRMVSEWQTNTNAILGAGNNFFTTDKHGQLGGIDILDYRSRVEYGCKLLGYSDKQGCMP
ncbi:hemagglutinin [Alcaligenes faecalis]|uniref:hemagglutinin n=1 Tax=Alcaligenes faecalis TaxID=511 RepID=UPI000F0B71D7|nr:hemagglutinin [Alcaligenes faecalis]AYR19087.1 hemagglutinin [Alcaligenes faecalis]